MTASNNSLPPKSDDSGRAGRPRTKRAAFRLFAWFLLSLILVCGLFVLATNGVYFYLSRPMAAVYEQTRSLLAAGVPEDADTQAKRLSHYQTAIDSLAALPEQLHKIDRQIWTFAVLIRADFQQNIPRLLAEAERGKMAVASYFEAAAVILSLADSFEASGSRPPASVRSLPAHVEWHSARIAAADQMERLYQELLTIADIDLAGRIASRSELRLDNVLSAVQPYRQPIAGLQALLDKSRELELALARIYALNPSPAGRSEVMPQLEKLLEIQGELLVESENLASNVPGLLQQPLSGWRNALPDRRVFIESLAGWWQNSSLFAQSLDSARIDRSTARRYIADSLKEPNVEKEIGRAHV